MYKTVYEYTVPAGTESIHVTATRPEGDYCWNGSDSSVWYNVTDVIPNTIGIGPGTGKPYATEGISTQRLEPMAIDTDVSMTNENAVAVEIKTSLVDEATGNKNNIIIRLNKPED